MSPDQIINRIAALDDIEDSGYGRGLSPEYLDRERAKLRAMLRPGTGLDLAGLVSRLQELVGHLTCERDPRHQRRLQGLIDRTRAEITKRLDAIRQNIGA